MPMGTQAYTYDCGTKALQLVMAYYGEEVPYYKLLRKVKSHKRYGIPERKIANIARGYGFKVASKRNCSLSEVKKHIENQQPVIVLLQAWSEIELTQEDWKRTDDFGHYSIVVGFEDGKVFFNDPLSFCRAWLTEVEFINRWHGDGKNRFSLIINGKLAKKEDEHMW
jgi:ABC-type bacteriocin/lantibiotic exporter with double-glycine peptidase domain